MSGTQGISFFEKYLTLWVAACIAAGLTLLGLVSCSLFDRDRDSLTAPAGGAI